MFYNSFRATKSAMKQRQRMNTANPRERLLNNPKRRKLRELLIEKFVEKYKNSNQIELIENEISRFIQQEKLTDVDLKRLDSRIQILILNKTKRDNLTKNLSNTLQNPPKNPEINKLD